MPDKSASDQTLPFRRNAGFGLNSQPHTSKQEPLTEPKKPMIKDEFEEPQTETANSFDSMIVFKKKQTNCISSVTIKKKRETGDLSAEVLKQFVY